MVLPRVADTRENRPRCADRRSHCGGRRTSRRILRRRRRDGDSSRERRERSHPRSCRGLLRRSCRLPVHLCWCGRAQGGDCRRPYEVRAVLPRRVGAVRRRFPRQGGACDGAGIQGSPRCRAAGAGGDCRERREVSRRRETRPQDRLLLGPARRTCRGRRACEWCRRPQLLLLFRRLRALCPCLRCRVSDAGRHLRRCACAREEK